MKITRVSMFTGIKRTLDIDVTQEQLDDYESGTLLQVAFSNLPAAEREFIKTGVTDAEWNETFK
tara:strand:+ start:706 stop:897 length:192 start_codon:yes stop_codon:yes gene_type:complete